MRRASRRLSHINMIPFHALDVYLTTIPLTLPPPSTLGNVLKGMINRPSLAKSLLYPCLLDLRQWLQVTIPSLARHKLQLCAYLFT